MSDGIAWAYEQREAAEARQLNEPYEVYRVKYDYGGAYYNIEKILTRWHPEDINYAKSYHSNLPEMMFLTKEDAVKWIKFYIMAKIKELNKVLDQWSSEEPPTDFDGIIRMAYPLATKNSTLYITGGSDGWEEIIFEGIGQIEEELEKNPVPFRITDIKSKFGTLRFYYNGGSERIEQIVDSMEARSRTTCETCGGLGRLRGQGWVYTACPQHVKEADK